MFDRNYLESLISNQVEEGPELEYKAALALQREDKKVMEITKDVSAFANSNGGILIYGVNEDKLNRNRPGAIDAVNRQMITKEWLEQILNSKIRPRIHGLNIHVIPIDDEHVVYLLEVPKGSTAHQADDKRYYRRHNFVVEPLFDHEIRDIMGRQKNPEITLDFLIRKELYRPSGETFGLENKETYRYWLDIQARNEGRIYAKYVNIVLTLPKKCLWGNNYSSTGDDSEDLYYRNTVRDLVSPDAHRFYKGQFAKAPQYGPTRYVPILPKTKLFIASVAINESSTDYENVFSWAIFADNAEPRIGSIAFEEVELS